VFELVLTQLLILKIQVRLVSRDHSLLLNLKILRKPALGQILIRLSKRAYIQALSLKLLIKFCLKRVSQLLFFQDNSALFGKCSSIEGLNNDYS
jgi:hypothetical protein